MNKVKSINIVFLITVFVSLVGSELMAYLPSDFDNYFLMIFISQILLILPMAIYIVKNKQNVRETIRLKKISISNIFLLIIFAFLIMPLMTLINLISQLFAANLISNSVSVMVESYPFIISLLAIAIIPSVLEEAVYRGVFYNEYRKINPLKGILLSAFLFGLMHMNFNQFSYAFAMGIIFAFLIEATDSILSTMIVHFIINGSSVVLSYLMILYNKVLASFNIEQQEIVLENEMIRSTILEVIGYYAIFALITTILAFFVYKAIAKNAGRLDFVKSIFKSSKHKGQNDSIGEAMISSTEGYEDKKIISKPLVIGMICCIVIMFFNEFNM